jgi:hypothetical protein
MRSRPSTGKIVFAAILFLAPVGLGVACLTMKGNPGIDNLLKKVGTIGDKGLRTLNDKIAAAAEAPPAPPPSPKPPPPPKTETSTTPPPTDEEIRKSLEGDMQKQWLAHLSAERAIKVLDRDPTEDQKKLIVQQREKSAAAKKRFDELQEQYTKRFGKEYRPQDE